MISVPGSASGMPVDVKPWLAALSGTHHTSVCAWPGSRDRPVNRMWMSVPAGCTLACIAPGKLRLKGTGWIDWDTTECLTASCGCFSVTEADFCRKIC